MGIAAIMAQMWSFFAKAKTVQGISLELLRIKARLDAIETSPTPGRDLDTIHEDLRALHEVLNGNSKALPEYGERLTDLEAQTKNFTLAIAEGIEKVERAERRVKASVRRARKELAEHGFDSPALEAEDADLRGVDDEGGGGGGVRLVPPDVGEPDQEASSVRGVTADELRRARGGS